MAVLILILVLLFGLWVYWDYGSTEASLDNLAESGFQADETLAGRPEVLFDRDAQKLAFVSATRATVYDYNQVLGWEWDSRPTAGYNDRSDNPEDYFLVFYLKYRDEPTVRVESLDETEQRYWRQRLEQLLGPRAP